MCSARSFPSETSSSSSESDLSSNASYVSIKRALYKSQAKKNQLATKLINSQRQLADATNKDRAVGQSTSETHPARSKSKTKPEYIKDISLRRCIENAAHKFAFMNMLWIRSMDDVFQLDIHPHYHPKNRFKSIEDQQQAIHSELRDVIPSQWHNQMSNNLVIATFNYEMNQQHSNGSTRVRKARPTIFGCSIDVFHDAKSRSETFRTLIGFTINDDGVGYYNALVPILYRTDNAQPDPAWKIFRNPIIMKTYSALVRGESSLYGLLEGAIAMAATYARFAASEDNHFQGEGI